MSDVTAAASAPAAVATPAPAAAAAAAKPVVRRGRGAFTTGLKCEMDESAVNRSTAPSTAATATATNASDAAAASSTSSNTVGIANRVFGGSTTSTPAAAAPSAATTNQSAAVAAEERNAFNPGAQYNPSKFKANRPSANFAAADDEQSKKEGGANNNTNDGNSTNTNAANGTSTNTRRGDTVREQLFRKERRRRSIIVVGDTLALGSYSTIRLSNYSDKKPARLENQFLKGVHCSVPLKRLRSRAVETTAAAEGEGEEEDGDVTEDGGPKRGGVEIKVTHDDGEGDADEQEATAAAEEKKEEDTEAAEGEDAEEEPVLSPEEAAQAAWEAKETEEIRREKQAKAELAQRIAEGYNDGNLHPLVADNGGDGSSNGHSHFGYHAGYFRGDDDDRSHVNPLLIAPVLTCTRFNALKKFFLETFHDLWCLEDNRAQRVSIKMEFGKAFYTRSSKASSHSINDFQTQSKVPFTGFVDSLNKETSQLFFINDAPLTVARGLDAVGEARERASYTLVKIFFFSKERQSIIVVRAIWNAQYDAFELTDIEHIGITFSWLVLNLEDVPAEEQERAAKVGNGEGVFLRHALPVEVQFRAFQRKRTVVGHPLEKKAKFILSKLTAAEHDRLRYGHGSYDSVDFHAIARDDAEEALRKAAAAESEAAAAQQQQQNNMNNLSSPNRPVSGLFGGNLATNRITPDTIPRMTRKHRDAAAAAAEEKKKASAAGAEVININDDEYEVASINIEHIETRKAKSGILLDSASGLLIEHFEDHLSRTSASSKLGHKYNSNPNFSAHNISSEESEDGSSRQQLNAGLTFLKYRSCNIHWKMDPSKTPLDNLEPALSDAFEICERVLNRANTFEHEEYVASKRRGGRGGAVGGSSNGRGGGGGRSAGIGAIGEGDSDDDRQYGDHHHHSNGGHHHHHNSASVGGSRKGGGISAIDANDHRNANVHSNRTHYHDNQHQYRNQHHGFGGGGRGAGAGRGFGGGGRGYGGGGRGGFGDVERGRGGGGGGRGGYNNNNYRQHNNNSNEDLWDMPASNYQTNVPPPLEHFHGVSGQQ